MHNFKSAFYIKYTYYVSKLAEVNSDYSTNMNFIKRDVKFWLRDSVVQDLYHTEMFKSRKIDKLDQTGISTQDNV